MTTLVVLHSMCRHCSQRFDCYPARAYNRTTLRRRGWPESDVQRNEKALEILGGTIKDDDTRPAWCPLPTDYGKQLPLEALQA